MSFTVENPETVANISWTWGQVHWQSVSQPGLIWSTALPRPLAAMFGWMARVPTPTWPLVLQNWPPDPETLRACACDDEACEIPAWDHDDEPPGAGYVEDEGTPRPPADTFGTRPGVPSNPRSTR